MTTQTPMPKYCQLLMEARSLSYLQGEDAYDQAVTYINAAFRELEKLQFGELSRIDRIAQNEMLHNVKATLIDRMSNFRSLRPQDERELSSIEQDVTSNEWLDTRIMYSTMHPYEDYFQRPPTHDVTSYSNQQKTAGILAVGVTKAMLVTRKARIERRLEFLLSNNKMTERDQRLFVTNASLLSIQYDGILKNKYLAEGATPMDWQKPVSQSLPKQLATGRSRLQLARQ